MSTIRTVAVVAFVVVVGCGEVSRLGADAAPPADAALPPDVAPGLDAGTSRCDPSKPFGGIQLVAGVNSPSSPSFSEAGPTLSPDERDMYFSSNRGSSTDLQVYRMYKASRRDPDSKFELPIALTSIQSNSNGFQLASVSSDQLTLYFHSDDQGMDHLYVSTRSIGEPFRAGVQFGPPHDTGPTEVHPSISTSGTTIYFMYQTAGGPKTIAKAQKGVREFGPPMLVDELNTTPTSTNNQTPVISANERSIFFASDRDPQSQSATLDDIWIATRTSAGDPFSNPMRVEELSTPCNDYPTWVSPDDCRLYFWSNRSTDQPSPPCNGETHIWQATRLR